MIAPGLVCAGGSLAIISGLRQLLEKWQASQLDLLGGAAPVELDFINLLGLETTLKVLTRLDDQRLVLTMLIILLSVIGGGLAVAVGILALGWIYNVIAAFSGGLKVEVQEDPAA